MIESARIVAVMALLAMAGPGGGCALDRVSQNSSAGPSVTLQVTCDDGRQALYETAEGEIRFAGGADVALRRFSWEGPLTDDDHRRLEAVIEEQGLLDLNESASAFGEAACRYDLEIRSGGRRNRAHAGDQHEGVAELHELLEEIAARRFEPVAERWADPEDSAARPCDNSEGSPKPPDAP